MRGKRADTYITDDLLLDPNLYATALMRLHMGGDKRATHILLLGKTDREAFYERVKQGRVRNEFLDLVRNAVLTERLKT